jgi:glucokinase
MDNPTILTFDIGGTDTRCGVFQDGGITKLADMKTPQSRLGDGDDPAQIIDILRQLTDIARQSVDKWHGVAVAITGMLRMAPNPGARSYGPFADYNLMLSSPNITGLRNIDIMALLESVGWNVRVHVENDANAALRSATDFTDAVGINMGTGIAAAVKEHGKIRRNPPFWSCYEIGHGFRWTFPEHLTRKCACGAVGCLEAVVGSRALRERYGVRPENASPEIYERMRQEIVVYGAPAILDTAKRFNQSTVLLSGRSVIGFNQDGRLLEDLHERLSNLDSNFPIDLHTADLPETAGMMGATLSMFDVNVLND